MSSRDACSLSIMFGIAMFTIVRSSSVMKKPSDTTTSTAHGFPRSLVMVLTITERAAIMLSHNPWLPAARAPFCLAVVTSG